MNYLERNVRKITIKYSFSGYLNSFKTLIITENHKVKDMQAIMKFNLVKFLFHIHLASTKFEIILKVNVVQRDKNQLLWCIFDYISHHKVDIEKSFEARDCVHYCVCLPLSILWSLSLFKDVFHPCNPGQGIPHFSGDPSPFWTPQALSHLCISP